MLKPIVCTLRTRSQYEWEVCEDDREWEMKRSALVEDHALPVRRRFSLAQWLWHHRLPILLLILLLATGTGSLLASAQVGIDQVERELAGMVAAEIRQPRSASLQDKAMLSDPWRFQIALDLNRLQSVAGPNAVESEVKVINQGDDWALVDVVIHLAGKQEAYRQKRVYRETEQGWTRITPAAAYWGRPQQLESRYFRFYFHAQDAAAVAAAAERLDKQYLSLDTDVLVEYPSHVKPVVLVDPEMPRWVQGRKTDPFAALLVASPTAMLAPVGLPASDLLVQAVMKMVTDGIAGQSTPHYEDQITSPFARPQ